MKYIDADKLREKITEQMESLPREVGRGAGTITSKGYGMMQAFQIMRSIIDSLQQEQPSLPDNLDDAANKFAVSYDQGTCDGIAQECFKAGAQWMAKKELECKNVIWLKDDNYDPLDNDWELGSVGLGHKGYYIPYSDLLKLPKEE